MKTTNLTTSIATFHILHRTGGVYDSFLGPIHEAVAEVARRNATDDGTTEMVSSFSDEAEMMEELAYYMGQLD